MSAVDSSPDSRQRYLRAAFSNQYNLILLSGSVSFSAALASWTPLLSGLVGEAIWLLAGPRLEFFRRRTDTQVERAELTRATEGLEPQYMEQVVSVEREANDIEQLCAARSDLTPEQRLMVTDRLRSLLRGFVEVATSHQRLSRAVAQAPVRELQSELSTLHQSLSTETDLGVRASLRRALSVAERRVKQLEGNEAARRSLELSLQTLQRSLSLLKEGAAGLSGAIELCAEIDVAAAQLSRASALEVERENELGGRVSILPPAVN
jgi:hypothetical protein